MMVLAVLVVADCKVLIEDEPATPTEPVPGTEAAPTPALLVAVMAVGSFSEAVLAVTPEVVPLFAALMMSAAFSAMPYTTAWR